MYGGRISLNMVISTVAATLSPTESEGGGEGGFEGDIRPGPAGEGGNNGDGCPATSGAAGSTGKISINVINGIVGTELSSARSAGGKDTGSREDAGADEKRGADIVDSSDTSGSADASGAAGKTSINVGKLIVACTSSTASGEGGCSNSDGNGAAREGAAGTCDSGAINTVAICSSMS